MELEIMSFATGCFAGGMILGMGVVIGLLVNRDALTRQVPDEEFDPEEEVMDDEFFERATHDPEEGGHKFHVTDDSFPSDDILEELDRLHRHSEY